MIQWYTLFSTVNYAGKIMKQLKSDRKDVSKAAECNYKENNRHLKMHFINGINNDAITSEIIKEITTIKAQVTLQVMGFSHAANAKMLKKLRKHGLLCYKQEWQMQSKTSKCDSKGSNDKCRNFGSIHQMCQCLLYCKTCSGCSKMNCFRSICRLMRGNKQGNG